MRFFHIYRQSEVAGMKKIMAVVLIVIFVTLLLPLAVVWIAGHIGNDAPKTQESGSVKVWIADEKRAEDMCISDYLKRVVSAEMPADFEEEALKAQAVAARTYLYSHIAEAEKGNVAENHGGAPVCTDSTHCQAYISEQKRRESWSNDADAKWDKISRAVDDTAGEIMTYKGEIISAVFHSTSSGSTEAAVDVWGSDVPYLQSVKSEGDEQSPKFHSELTVSEDEFRHTVDEHVDGTDWSGELISNINRSDAGGIISLDVGGVNIKGTDFRSMFSLRSTNIEIKCGDGEVNMLVKGFGHGVGMSQYGADYLASAGKKYDEILKTYYTGIKIEKK